MERFDLRPATADLGDAVDHEVEEPDRGGETVNSRDEEETKQTNTTEKHYSLPRCILGKTS